MQILTATPPLGVDARAALPPKRVVADIGLIAGRNLRKVLRSPGLIVFSTIQPLMQLVLFAFVFGAIASVGRGTSYKDFVVPAVLVQAITFSAMGSGVGIAYDLQSGMIDRFRSLPIARSAPLVGSVMADVVRYLLLCVVFLAFGYAIGFRVTTGPVQLLAAVGVSIAFALCFCWISVFVGMTVRTSGAVQGVMFLLVLPLSFGSNVFVPTNSLPGWLQVFVNVNPISHLVSTFRGLVLGGPVAGPLGWTVLWMLGLLVVFVPLALRAYNRKA
jgi:oleandomycin transport system permease protein